MERTIIKPVITAGLISLTLAGGLVRVNAADPTETIIFAGNARNELGQNCRALFCIQSDGTDRVQITRAGDIRGSSVSPIGRKIAYMLNARIHVCDWDGANDVDITPIGREHYQPKWSPDGRSILFASDRLGNSEIFVMDPDGGNARNLSWCFTAIDISPAWSPDGKQVVFSSDRKGTFDLIVMDADGYNQRAITDGTADCREPAWSPDGRWIAFSMTRDGKTHLYLIKPDGTGLKPLTTGNSWNGQPAWNADSKRIAFVSDRDGGSDIFVMDVENGQCANVTRTPDDDETYPTWTPKQIGAKPLEIKEARVGGMALPRPRLLFTANDIPVIQKRLSGEPFSAAWTKFLASCDAYLNPSNALSGNVELSISQITNKLDRLAAWQTAVFNLAFAYQLTGKEDYGRRGAEWLAKAGDLLARYHGGCLGLWTVDPNRFCCSYDWLYSTLSDEQKAPLRTVLAQSARNLYQQIIASPEMLSAIAMRYKRTCNFSMFAGSEMGMIELALNGESAYDPACMSAALKVMENLANWWFDESGACKEWNGYFIWSSESGAPFIATALKHNLMPFMQRSPMMKWPYWLVMASANRVSVITAMGDDTANAPKVPLAYLEAFKGDPYLELLWAGSAVAAAPPKPEVESLLWWHAPNPDWSLLDKLPRSEFFREPGVAILRSSWVSNAPMLSVSAPIYGGHLHADGGSIQLFGYGARLLIDLGYGAPEPEEANNVLVNGQGRGRNPPALSRPLLRDFVRAPLGDSVVADLTEAFAARSDGHLNHNHVTVPWLRMDKAVRYAVMVACQSNVPPYFVIHDDCDRNGQTNVYESQFYVTRDIWFDIQDHDVTTRPLYQGPWLETAAATSKAPWSAAFTFTVREPGEYAVWFFMKGNQSGVKIDGALLPGAAGAEVLSSENWQWKPLLAPGTNRIVATTNLVAGEHKLAHAGKFARIMLTRQTNAAPWLPDAPEVKDAILLKAENAELKGSNGALKTLADNGPQTLLAFLNPAPIAFAPKTYTFRTVHFGKVLVTFPRIVARSATINPRFLTMIYPFQPGMEQPVIERHSANGVIWAKVRWKEATDWIISANATDGKTERRKDGNDIIPVGDLNFKTDAAMAIVRQSKDGKVSWKVIEGAFLSVDGREVMKSDKPVSQGSEQ